MSTPIPPEDSGSTPPIPPAYSGPIPPAYSGPTPPAPPAPPAPFGHPNPVYDYVEAARDPLSVPLHGATPVQAVSRFFRKYATFSGRASRSEYWWMQLALVILYVVPFLLSVSVAVATGSSTSGPFADVVLAVVFLGTIVPTLALTWRRLHDANLAGPWYFITFVPSVGGIILICLCAQRSNPAGARFDAHPRPVL